MKLNRTACSLALLGILCAGLVMPVRGRATECDAYTNDATAEDSYEPNNTPATATLLTNDVWIGAGGDPNCGVMFANNDIANEYDYYKIVVPAGNTGITVDLRFKYSLGDMTLRLVDTDGTTVLATQATEFDNELLEYSQSLAAGTYYIWVFSGQAGNNRYKLMAHVSLPSSSSAVTPSVLGGNGSVSPSSAQTVTSGSTVPFTLTPSSGYTASRTVGGTCPQGSWIDSTHYTTGAITTDCTTVFSFGLTKTVTSSWTPAAGGSVTLGSTQNVTNGEVLNVASGDMPEFTVTANQDYTTNSTVTGSCPAGSWAGDVYKINSAITTNCTVIFGFSTTAVTHTVTPSAGTGGSFTPTEAQTVNHNATKAFTVTASSGYAIYSSVGGTCPAGTWNSNVYTTGAITADCTVIFGFIATHTVTPSAGTGGSITPTGAQTVNHNATKAFTVTASSGYAIYSSVGGTCPAGTWNSNVYTTGAITADCTVIFGFIATHTVTPSAGTGGSITPTGAQTVNHNATKAFTVTASNGYTTDTTVGGTCPQGSWNSNVYTTGAIITDCTVSFTFTSNSTPHTVTPSAGTGGSISPIGAQTVLHNTTKAFTVTANSGYTTDATVGGTCPAGSWSGNVYTTGAILADCTVSFKFSKGVNALPAIYKQILLKAK
jgi:hypothetical protein